MCGCFISLGFGFWGYFNKLSMVTAGILCAIALGFENPHVGENKLIVIALQSQKTGAT